MKLTVTKRRGSSVKKRDAKFERKSSQKRQEFDVSDMIDAYSSPRKHRRNSSLVDHCLEVYGGKKQDFSTPQKKVSTRELKKMEQTVRKINESAGPDPLTAAESD